jgi:hypothetical protein
VEGEEEEEEESNEEEDGTRSGVSSRATPTEDDVHTKYGNDSNTPTHQMLDEVVQ